MGKSLTEKEAAAFLGFSLARLRRELAASRVPAVKVGDEWRFNREELLEYQRRNRPKPDPGETVTLTLPKQGRTR